MKGEILKLCPEARLVDITHHIAPQSIRHGAYCLEQSVGSFPPGTLFLCVVDPGVGSSRRALAVDAGGFRFVGPDNGLLGLALDTLKGPQSFVEISQGSSPEKEVSFTFHGRDIFAPSIARLANGQALSQIGSEISDIVAFPARPPRPLGASVEVSVLCSDHFGNVTFELKKGQESLPFAFAPGLEVLLKDQPIPFCRTFSEVEPGDSLFLWNSSSYLELAVRDGHAQKRWGLSETSTVTLRRFERD